MSASFDEKKKDKRKLRAFPPFPVRARLILPHISTRRTVQIEKLGLRNSKLIALHNTSVLIRGYYAVGAYE